MDNLHWDVSYNPLTYQIHSFRLLPFASDTSSVIYIYIFTTEDSLGS